MAEPMNSGKSIYVLNMVIQCRTKTGDPKYDDILTKVPNCKN